MTQFLLQLAGVPGSGKSALARLIGARTGAVVIDKDVLKSAALDAGVDESQAGRVAYETFFALADHLLGQEHSVILDSPSFFASIPANGFSVAQRRCVPYHFIECICPDNEELSRRLRERPRLRSHPSEPVEDRQTFAPPGPYLRIDTTEPIERCLAIALEYLGLE